jgi:hypothetical protein
MTASTVAVWAEFLPELPCVVLWSAASTGIAQSVEEQAMRKLYETTTGAKVNVYDPFIGKEAQDIDYSIVSRLDVTHVIANDNGAYGILVTFDGQTFLLDTMRALALLARVASSTLGCVEHAEDVRSKEVE